MNKICSLFVFLSVILLARTATAAGCSSIEITQRMVNSWDTGSEWNALLTNTGASSVSSAVVDIDGPVTNVWVLENQGNGQYSTPGYMYPLAPGQSLNFGFTQSGQSPLQFRVVSVTCESSSSSAPSSSSEESSSSSNGPVTCDDLLCDACSEVCINDGGWARCVDVHQNFCEGTTTSIPPSSSSSESSESDSTSPCFVISQTLRTTWMQDSVTYYLYDLVITNFGASASVAPTFSVSALPSSPSISLVQSWNILPQRASDDHHIAMSLYDPDTQQAIIVGSGESYRGAGYIVKAAPTQVDNNGNFCA